MSRKGNLTLLQSLDWLIPGCKVQGNGKTRLDFVSDSGIQAGRMQSNSYQQEMFSRHLLHVDASLLSVQHWPSHLHSPERFPQPLPCWQLSSPFLTITNRTNTTVLLMALLDFTGNTEGCRMVFNVCHNLCPAVGLIFLLGMLQWC